MSNIKTIVVNNETYNIEDAVARNLLSNVYNKDEINDRFAGLKNYDDTAIKARIQALENAEETDPTVPSWAKAEHKPTYTASEVGLGNVPNVATNDQTPSYTEATTLAKLTSGEKLSVAFGKISKAITDLISHLSDSVKHITSTERTNWNAAKTHADSAHAPSTAQANVIETVKVNGTALTPNNKAVDITVPNYTFEVKSDGHLYVSY